MNAKKILVGLGVALPALAAAVLLYPRLLPKERYSREEGARVLGAPGKLVEVGGRAVHYVEAGPEGAPAVVLVHGFYYSTFMWKETIAALSKHFRCYAIDLFGFGYSERPWPPGEPRYGYDLWSRQVLEFMDARKIERAHLVGQSLGGGTIMQVAAEHPERVDKLVLICPAGIPNPKRAEKNVATLPWIGEFLLNLPGEALNKKILRENFLYDEAKLTDAYVAEVSRPTLIRGTRASSLWIMRNVDLGGIEDKVRAFGALGKKSMLVWGNEDAAIPVSNAEKIREIVKPEKVLLIGKAGHVPHHDRPEVANPAILEFLSAGAP